MKTKITHLILSTIFAVILAFIATVATIMIIPILGYIFTAMAQIMNDNFDIAIRVLCWLYSVLLSYYLYKNSPIF